MKACSRRKILIWGVATPGALVVLVLAALGLFLSTGTGADLTLRYLRARLAPQTSIAGVDGNLLSPLVLVGIHHETETLSVGIDTLRLEWSLSRLLRRTLQIDLIQLDGLALEQRSAVGDGLGDAAAGKRVTDSIPALELPIDLVVARGVVRRISVASTARAQPMRFDSLTGAARTTRDTIVIDRLALFGPEFSGEIQGTVRASGLYPLDLSYAWDLTARGVHLVGSGGAVGDVERLRVSQDVSRPVQAELRAVIDSLLTTRSFDARASVSAFDLQDIDSTWVAARLAGVVVAAGTVEDLRADADLQLANRLVGNASAQLAISRRDSAWNLDSAVVALDNGTARIRGTGQALFVAGEPTIDGVVEWRRLGWPRTDPHRVTSDGRIRVAGSLPAYRADGMAQVRGERLPQTQLRLAARGSRDSLELQARADGLGDELTLIGRVTLRPELRWRLLLEGKALELAALLPSPARITDLNFTVRAQGRGRDTTIVGTLELVHLSGLFRDAPVSGSAQARLHRTGLILDTATVDLLEGRLEGAGAFDWRPSPSGRLSFMATDIRPALLFADSSAWPGAISARARANGPFTREGASARVEADTVYGVLRGEPLVGALRAEISRDRYTVHELALDWGSLRLDAAGVLGARLEGHVELVAPDLSLAVPGGSGSLRARCDIQGDRSTPRIWSNLEANELSYRGVRLGLVRASGRVDLAASGLFDWSLEGRGIAWQDVSADELRLGLTGQRNDHRLDASLWSGRTAFRLGARGVLDEYRWTGELDRMDLSDSTAGDWHLLRATPIAISASSVVVADSVCSRSGEAMLCVTGEWHRKGPWSLSSLVKDLPIARLAALLPAGLEASGEVQAMVDVAGTAHSGLTGRASVTAASGELSFPLRAGEQHLAYDRGSIEIEAGDSGVSATMAVALTRTGGLDTTYAQVHGQIELPDYRLLLDSLPQRPIRGRLSVALADVAALEAISPYLMDVTGSVNADLVIAGTVTEPAIVGDARLSGGGARIPALGLEVRDVVLEGVGEGRSGFRLSGSARSGGGTVQLAGRGSLAASTDSLLVVNVTGERFQIANTPEAQIWISPDLSVTAAREAVAVDGEVRIPRAQVELREIPALAVPLSPDLIIVGDTNPAAAPPINLRARVRLALGDSISFRGFGLTGRPAGSVFAIEEPGQATTATGQLTIGEGTYRAYGQELTIETGRLIYAGGPIDNPGLDVRAVRHARDDVAAGLDVKGTLRSPEVTVFSDPPMMQSEALAYLLLGRPVSELSTSEGSYLSNAAVSLGLRGGNVLAQRLARRFGLDEARLETQGSWEQASLFAGKYLSPRLYVSYGLGLFESMSLFRVRYLISRRWTLQAETGEGTSTDIHYRVERGR